MTSALCADCGVDTAPCSEKRGCRHKGKWEWYVVNDEIWIAAGGKSFTSRLVSVMCGVEPDDIILCIGCLETRIGRELSSEDFDDVPLNWPDDPWHTDRLRDRMTREGAQQ